MRGSSFQTRLQGWMRSILGRSVLFTLITLLITLLVAAMAINSSQNALRNEIVTRNSVQVSAVAEQLAISLDKTMDIQRELLYDEDINRLGVMPGYYPGHQKILAMLRVMDRMYMLTSSSPLIKQACFMAPSIGRIITASSVVPLSDADFARCNHLCVEQTQALIQMDGEFYIMMAYPTYNHYLKENGASYLLALQLDQAAIAAFFAAHSGLTDEALFLFSDDGQIITSVNAQNVPCDPQALYVQARANSAFDMTADDGMKYLVSSAINTSTTKTLTLVKLQPYGQAFSVLNMQGYIFMALAVLLVIANLAYAAYVWHTIHKPLNKLGEAFEQVEKGDFSLRIHHTREDDFSDMYQRFNMMNRRLGELIEQVYMQTIRTQRAELKQLQSQINPHFLYNNLFMMRSLAQLGDTATIELLSTELGEYFRYVTRLGKQEVPLAAEDQHARNYSSIQDMRFSSRIKLVFPPLPEEFREVIVPRLILQPLLENAYEHGLKNTSAHGLLQITYEQDEDDVLILVEDNGVSLTDDTLHNLTASLSNPDIEETTGLINIHRRLQLRFGVGYGLTFTRGETGGLCVTMRIPITEGSKTDAQNTDR